MKTESLHALIIDRHFGELSPEAVELLELHLAANEHARAEVDQILESLRLTQEAVMRHPELARVPMTNATPPKIVKKSPTMPWMARAAAVALLAGTAGFFAGRSNAPELAASSEKTPAPRKESPWAKYRMTFDPAGEGMQVVREDVDKLLPQSLR